MHDPIDTLTTLPIFDAQSMSYSVPQEEVVREAESKQALLTEAAQNTGNEAQRQEDVSSGQVRRLLDAALRNRMSTPGLGQPTAASPQLAA